MNVQFKRIILLVAAAGCCALLRSSYRQDAALLFFGGLCALVLLAHVARRVEPRLGQTQFAGLPKRLAVVCLLLPITDFCYGMYLSTREGRQDEVRPVFSYRDAQGDQRAFALWWRTYVAEWNRSKRAVQRDTPGLPVPYEFIPGTTAKFFDGTVSINSHGFADKEFPAAKGERYRIVVMGSSHTEGPVLRPGDDPWPLILEGRIGERSASQRPIEVINAGASAYDMEDNLYRLQTRVLPLEPDMIVTYFGYNGFKDYAEAFDIALVPPDEKPRPSLLLSKIEYNFRDWWHQARSRRRGPLDLASIRPRLLECEHTRHYRRYIELTREHRVRLVICNFNMAVADDSPDEVIQFYEMGFPNVRMCIDANRINSAVVLAVADGHQHVTTADVQADLNGRHEGNYVDLVHMTYRGKSILAENVLRTIAPLVERDLERSLDQAEPILPVSAELPVLESNTLR